MKKRANQFVVVTNTILRVVMGVGGLVLMFMGAADGRPLISLIGAVHVVLCFFMATRAAP